jgi:HlyD family secretion protein
MRYGSLAIALVIGMSGAAGGCARPVAESYQGYVEGEFVHVASGAGGRLEKLFVHRGETVAADAPLFQLEANQEAAAVRQADEALSAARAQLSDLKTGRRAPEIEVVRAQYEQAVVAEQQSAAQLERNAAQFEAGGIPRQQVDDARAKHDLDVARVRELRSQLEVAAEPARPNQIQAQSSQVAAANAALAQTRTRLDEKRIVATQGGLVVDTLFQEGEWVTPGVPVVRMLPPANVKLRFFVPEPALGFFKVGGAILIRCEGCASTASGTVTYVSAEPEFTPPVIYSNETRAKLVFMVEARPSAEAAASLRPGQPVTITRP